MDVLARGGWRKGDIGGGEGLDEGGGQEEEGKVNILHFCLNRIFTKLIIY